MDAETKKRNPYIAAALNFPISGLGYLYIGQPTKGFTAIITLIVFLIVFPSFLFLLLLFTMIDSFILAKRLQEQEPIGKWDFFWGSKSNSTSSSNDRKSSVANDPEDRSPRRTNQTISLLQRDYHERQWIVLTDDPSIKVKGPNVHILPVSWKETTNIQFPPGHPRNRIVYVGHPTVAPLYYPAAQFHRLTLEHKFAEAIRLLISLGAVEIEVEHLTGWSKEIGVNFALPFNISGLQTGIRADANSGSRNQLLFKATLNGSTQPHIPQGLTWFIHEPTWRRVAEARLRNGLQKFSLDLRYEDDFGVNASLESTLSRLGFDLGGKFEDYKSTVWRIVGSFNTTNNSAH